MENKFAPRTYGFNFRIGTIYLPRTSLLSTIKIMLLPIVNVLLPTLVLLPTVYGKEIRVDMCTAISRVSSYFQIY